MLKQNRAGDFVEEIIKLLPQDIRKHRQDLKKNIRAAFNARLVKMDLVTREEFDIQSELLGKTRALVDELEETVSRLESQLRDRDS